MAKVKECFLVMPIRKPGTEEYEYFRALRDTVLEPVMKQLGYNVTRADDITQSGSITADVLKRLATADLVVADLTDLNPNVFYELGVRHTLRGQGTIMVVDKDRTTVPFDLSPYRVIEFTPDLRGIEKLREMLIKFGNAISGAEPDPTKDNPVHDFLSSLPDDIYAHAEGSSEGALRQEIARLREQLRHYAERFGADSPTFLRQEAAIDTVSAALQTLKGRGLGWLGVESKSGLAEESGDEAGSSLDAVQLVAHRGGELAGGAGGEVSQAVLHHRPGAFSRFATVHGSLDKGLVARRLSAGRACCGWWSWPGSYEHATLLEAGRRGRRGRGHLLQMVALTSVPDGELWRSFPESTRDDILRLLGMLLERLAVSAGLAAEGTGGEHDAAG